MPEAAGAAVRPGATVADALVDTVVGAVAAVVVGTAARAVTAAMVGTAARAATAAVACTVAGAVAAAVIGTAAGAIADAAVGVVTRAAAAAHGSEMEAEFEPEAMAGARERAADHWASTTRLRIGSSCSVRRSIAIAWRAWLASPRGSASMTGIGLPEAPTSDIAWTPAGSNGLTISRSIDSGTTAGASTNS
ncbi:MAG: hypothetical protein QM674_02640 [Burkholderiaceae bacterium]